MAALGLARGIALLLHHGCMVIITILKLNITPSVICSDFTMRSNWIITIQSRSGPRIIYQLIEQQLDIIQLSIFI